MTEGNGGFGPVPPRPKDWNDVFAITGGLRSVSINLIDQGRVDWEYHFSSSDMRPCGRDGCVQEHAHGWIVALRGGQFVNIGNDCAHKYAHPDSWSAGVASYYDRVQSDARVVSMVQAREEAQRKQHWLDTTPEIDRAISLHESFTRGAGGPLLREIERRAERGLSRIEVDVRLSKEEREERRVMILGGRSDAPPDVHIAAIETRHVGEIAGLSCFRRNPRDARTRLQRLVTTLLTWAPREDDKDAMRSMKQATRDLAPFSNELNESIVATRNFFTEANLRTLMKLDVIRGQGILSIELDGPDRVRVVRRPHWDRAA